MRREPFLKLIALKGKSPRFAFFAKLAMFYTTNFCRQIWRYISICLQFGTYVTSCERTLLTHNSLLGMHNSGSKQGQITCIPRFLNHHANAKNSKIID